MISRVRVSLRIAAGLALVALAACGPLPDSGGRELTAEGIRPGATSDVKLDRPKPVETSTRYLIATPFRNEPSEMTVTLRRGSGGGYVRDAVVRMSQDNPAEAKLVATMLRQGDDRQTEIVGSDVVLRATDQIDRHGRTVSSERGGVRISYDPHDCRATLGECRTVRTDPDGRPTYLLVRTTESEGIWREEIRRDPARDPQGRTTLMQETFYSLDENGFLIDMNRIDHERDIGRYQEIRRAE